MPVKTATKSAKTSKIVVPSLVKAAAVPKAEIKPPRAQPLQVTAKPGVKTTKLAKPATKPVAAPARAIDDSRYVLENQVGFHLRKAHQRATRIFADVMAEYDVTPMQFAALAKLDELGAISQNQLGRLTSLDPATILGVVGRLYRQNWLRSRPAIEDPRLMLIELTPDGISRVREMQEKAAKVSKMTLAPLSASEAATLSALLARLG